MTHKLIMLYGNQWKVSFNELYIHNTKTKPEIGLFAIYIPAMGVNQSQQKLRASAMFTFLDYF